MTKIAVLILSVLLAAPLAAGPYAPAANQVGTAAIGLDDPRIARWATHVESYTVGEDADTVWQDTSRALTPATTNSSSVVSLGRGGEIVLEFVPPIKNGPGFDFAVFENSFAHTFLELAFVEVSADGVSYERFANSSKTASAVGPFGLLDPTNIDGLAGKYIGGFGTPFDLSSLVTAPSEIRFVKLLDVTGGTSRASDDQVIYDPFPTQGSAGFDLSGIAVLVAPPITISPKVMAGELVITWSAIAGETYLIESSPDLRRPWQPVAEKVASGSEESASFPMDSARQFYRVTLGGNNPKGRM
jgi:hypothetical protein